eukprot:5646682-Pleurochrysis_carterae.AAC.2
MGDDCPMSPRSLFELRGVCAAAGLSQHALGCLIDANLPVRDLVRRQAHPNSRELYFDAKQLTWPVMSDALHLQTSGPYGTARVPAHASRSALLQSERGVSPASFTWLVSTTATQPACCAVSSEAAAMANAKRAGLTMEERGKLREALRWMLPTRSHLGPLTRKLPYTR